MSGKWLQAKEEKITPWTEQKPKALWTKSFLCAHSISEMERDIRLGSVGIVFGRVSLPTGFHLIRQNSLLIGQFFVNLNRLQVKPTTGPASKKNALCSDAKERANVGPLGVRRRR